MRQPIFDQPTLIHFLLNTFPSKKIPNFLNPGPSLDFPRPLARCNESKEPPVVELESRKSDDRSKRKTFERQLSFKMASPPAKPFAKVSHNRRHSSSSMLHATNDFLYFDSSNVDKYKPDKIAAQPNSPPANMTTPKKKRLSQIFEKLGFENAAEKSLASDKPVQTDGSRHNWAMSLFRNRRKEAKFSSQRSSFCKIEEESVVASDAVPTTQTSAASSVTSSVQSRHHRHFRSKSERDLEGIAKICPNLGIRSIDRGSQTELESPKTGFSWLWSVVRIWNQNLQTEFFSFISIPLVQFS